ncbi:hypothetical protein [Streptomyces marianii]|uniref:Uncharacterized protein n=1 Tax=Streptomyces marianii TaxID=1817406 RepID=A0A5R9DTL9_9ACTN|nr:hypothetical protein [Streptomyces marianii]TLQ39007.1 hypothetical protein FEF34_40055 [Streptomyces marianii]
MNPEKDTTALAAIEKAAAGGRTLYAPSVMDEAAELLTELWAAGERHGVTPTDWSWTTSLPSAALDVIARRHTSAPDPERTADQVRALQRDLIEALNSPEIGLTARLGPRASVIVERLPESPRGGYHADADLAVGIYTNGGWDISFDHDMAPVVSIAAPASKAGAAEVAVIVRAVARGELGNPFRP